MATKSANTENATPHYTKRDVMNEMRAYVRVLEHDIERESNQLAKDILRNVITSLNKIINDFKD